MRHIAKEELRKAKRQLIKAELVKREAIKRVGIAARAAERERKRILKDIEAQVKKQVLGIDIIPPELLIPIRDS